MTPSTCLRPRSSFLLSLELPEAKKKEFMAHRIEIPTSSLNELYIAEASPEFTVSRTLYNKEYL